MASSDRRIAVLTTGRQDWGILRSTCAAIRSTPGLELILLVGGMHVSDRHGGTVRLLRDDGFTPFAELAWLDGAAGADPPATHQAAGALERVGSALRETSPAALVLAGDRLETAAAAMAATLERVPIVHLHGGEVTAGAFDDQLRNAITKLAHLHLVSHEEHAQRVVAMGEDPETVHVVGAPGLDSAYRDGLPSQQSLERDLGRPLVPPVVLVTVQPATLDPEPSAVVHPIIAAMSLVPATYVVTLPNSDPGGDPIRRAFLELGRPASGAPLVVEALGELRYWGLMRIADAMLGNSSSGLVEAPALDLPAVNVGERQAGRRREANVLDVPAEPGAIAEALRRALDPSFRATVAAAHPAGIDGRAGERIARIIDAWHPASPPRKKVLGGRGWHDNRWS
jgi:UDP-hydrolysing UDP-N-acetyl-D-glucosamine 2-epimerase